MGPKFAVGDLALHKSGTLDARKVVEVSPDGEFIKIWILTSASGWLPAANYDNFGGAPPVLFTLEADLTVSDSPVEVLAAIQRSFGFPFNVETRSFRPGESRTLTLAGAAFGEWMVS